MSDHELNEGIISVGYGDLMRKLQLMELNLWQILALRMKPRVQAEQAFAKVEKWDGTTFGSLVRGMKEQEHWPDGIVEDLLQAGELRNCLAHNFLREFFLAEPSQENYQRAPINLSSGTRGSTSLTPTWKRTSPRCLMSTGMTSTTT